MLKELSELYLSQPNYMTFCPIFVAVPKDKNGYPKVFLLEKEMDDFLKRNSSYYGRICGVEQGTFLHKLLRLAIDVSVNPEKHKNIL
jgi:hypothetical protein